MCGIAGIVAPDPRRYREVLQRMTDALAHRGPDGEGHHFFAGCALGHRRLKIVDLETGRQPMLSPVSATGITFNGEIYGYRDLRRELGDYPFRTASDTEVILALHDRHGDRFLDRLPGMFAFALWNEENQELLCVRDRFGEKPLYYARGRGGEFLFASEIRAILASGLVHPVLDRESLSHYLKYLYVPPSRTIYRTIQTLPPGYCLRLRQGEVRLERYWQLPSPGPPVGLDEAVEQFRELLDRAVASQLVADVPVGAFLSGGLDSSTVVAVAARHHGRLKTFSFDFEGCSGDIPYARAVAERYGTDHAELADRSADIGELLVAMQEVYDEPFGDSSNIPTYLISKLARRHVTAVLTGDGGDELFGGYTSWYRPLLLRREGVPLFLAALLRGGAIVARRAGLPLPQRLRDLLEGMYLGGAYPSLLAAHAGQKEVFRDADLKRFGLPLPKRNGGGGGGETLDDVMRADIQDYMPGDILVKIDRASMAHGLEVRAPFLDIGFASFCISLPWHLKVTREQDKVVLREAFASQWPEPLLRRGKLGFGAPVDRWLKRETVRGLKERTLGDPRAPLFSLLPFRETREAVAADNYRTWALLVLGLWLERRDWEVEK